MREELSLLLQSNVLMNSRLLFVYVREGQAHELDRYDFNSEILPIRLANLQKKSIFSP